jgi:hypothetical protein
MPGATLAELQADLDSIQAVITSIESGGAQARGAYGRQWTGLSITELYAERRRLRAEIAEHPSSRAASSFTQARPVR